MTGERIEDRARRLIEEGFGHGRREILDELMAPDVVEHQRGNASGIDGAKAVVGQLHRWMSDFELTVEDLALAGDVVWTRNRGRGVNTGPVMGNPPTGRPVQVDVFDVLRFRDGRVVEHWGVADQLGLLLQLGLFGRPAAAPAAGPAGAPAPGPTTPAH